MNGKLQPKMKFKFESGNSMHCEICDGSSN